MNKLHFDNPFPDYKGGEIQIDTELIKTLIDSFVQAILENTNPGSRDPDERGDLYVGNSGIAYMFWKLHRSPSTRDFYPSMEYAEKYIQNAKKHAYQHKKRADERCAFLCGNAGIYAVSAVISYEAGKSDVLQEDIHHFLAGMEACKPIAFTKYGCDEVLVGRAGYLSGCYWLNDLIEPSPISDEEIVEICETVIQSGRKYSQSTKAPLPLMYQYHGTEYLGAAHGLSAILHMLLDSPWFRASEKLSDTKLKDIRASIDFFLTLQDREGNFPVALEDLQTGREKRLLHWCHGAPGAIYLFIKSYRIFGDQKYLDAAKKAADLIWEKGLLKKGPGICHGVSGNGYVFLVMYRLTQEEKYLYRANKFMEFLNMPEFKRARIPDRPYSLYEGLAGTVCFLIDLLEPATASFPFMDVFHS